MPQLQCEEIRFPSADGVHTVAASMYTMPGVPVRAVLQLSHGMCEYVRRYAPMADFYAAHGIAWQATTTWATAGPSAPKRITATSANPTATAPCWRTCTL